MLGLLVIAALVIGWVLWGTRRQAAQAQRRHAQVEAAQARALWGGATVVNLRNDPRVAAAPGEHGLVRVSLRLEVQANSGEKYQATTEWLVEPYAVAYVQPGQSLSVKIDTQDPAIIYPNAPWARYWVWD